MRFDSIFLFGLLAPLIIAKVGGLSKVFPLVFIQIGLGATIKYFGLFDWLNDKGIDFLHNPLNNRVFGYLTAGAGMTRCFVFVVVNGQCSTLKPQRRRSLSIRLCQRVGLRCYHERGELPEPEDSSV